MAVQVAPQVPHQARAWAGTEDCISSCSCPFPLLPARPQLQLDLGRRTEHGPGPCSGGLSLPQPMKRRWGP